MIKIDHFTFGPFQENTYVLSDETRQCVVIDPGCYTDAERAELKNHISAAGLKPVKLLNTHCHIDHVFGNKFISELYKVGLEIHKKDLPVLHSLMEVAHVYQLNAEPSPEPVTFLEEGDTIKFGNSKLDILFCPGHCPGHVVFVCHDQKFVIGGDVLFYGSIGRTDLPGGHYQTLIDSIKNKLFPLGDDYTVYSGHGPETNIGFERRNNPFLT
ncbi:MAG TPA: MBL fold metallo-hydrolase [Bacteroidia bacterium]|jgi:glyoxylase-like metal-dependent hydrolase (beta-lactamase superfamily II)